MSEEVTVTIDTRLLDEKIHALAERATNVEEVMQQVAVLLEFYVMENFTEGASKWPPLSDTTKRLRRKSKTPQPLQDTGIMKNSIFTQFGPGDGGYSGGGDAFAAIITLDTVAPFHLGGTRNMPQRNFFDVPLDDILQQGVESTLDAFVGEDT